MHADFLEHGEQAICEVRENKPDQYLKVIASIVPKDFVIHEGESALERIIEQCTEEQLIAVLAGLGEVGRAAGNKPLNEDDIIERFNQIH